MRPRMIVKDVMTSPVVTTEDASRTRLPLMLDNKVGCVIVIDKAGNAIGIITERDLVVRVIAKNLSQPPRKPKNS